MCSRGDRLGICVTQLDAKQVERGLACTPGEVKGPKKTALACATCWYPCPAICTPRLLYCCVPAGTVPTFEAAVAAVEKIRFYSGEVRSRSKMHITVGHVTGRCKGCVRLVGPAVL